LEPKKATWVRCWTVATFLFYTADIIPLHEETPYVKRDTLRQEEMNVIEGNSAASKRVTPASEGCVKLNVRKEGQISIID